MGGRERERFIRGSTLIRCMYGLRTNVRGMGGLEEWVDGGTRGMGG